MIDISLHFVTKKSPFIVQLKESQSGIQKIKGSKSPRPALKETVQFYWSRSSQEFTGVDIGHSSGLFQRFGSNWLLELIPCSGKPTSLVVQEFTGVHAGTTFPAYTTFARVWSAYTPSLYYG